jgi:hypothetical protein
MTRDERHEDFSDDPIRCVECSGVHVSPRGSVMDAADDLLAATDRFEHALGESRR